MSRKHKLVYYFSGFLTPCVILAVILYVSFQLHHDCTAHVTCDHISYQLEKYKEKYGYYPETLNNPEILNEIVAGKFIYFFKDLNYTSTANTYKLSFDNGHDKITHNEKTFNSNVQLPHSH